MAEENENPVQEPETDITEQENNDTEQETETTEQETETTPPASGLFVSADEMKSVLYRYRMNQIAESDSSIVEQAILAAVSEVRSYFEAANERRETASLTQQQYNAWKLYDVDAIFSATGSDRHPFVVRMVQRVAAYNICELSNADIIYDHVKERYDNTISTLEKIAGMGEYATSRIILSGLPSPDPSGTSTPNAGNPFRMVSRPKFHHE